MDSVTLTAPAVNATAPSAVRLAERAIVALDLIAILLWAMETEGGVR